MQAPRYFTAEEAATELGIQPATLYSYVSRGLIRSEATGKGKRRRRYHGEDIRKLKTEKERGRSPDRTLRSALSWGAPLLDSGLTLILENAFYYRGLDATVLAHTHSIEEVALLLWTGDMDLGAGWKEGRVSSSIPRRAVHWIPRRRHMAPITRMQVVLPLLAKEDVVGVEFSGERMVWTGARILTCLASVAVGNATPSDEIGKTIQAGWAPRKHRAVRLFKAALILCADHELNTSTLAARCAASAGASPYGAVLAGLATLQGARHGGTTERVDAFMSEVLRSKKAKRAVENRLRRGDSIPGFKHVLYPRGDPRAKALFAMMKTEFPRSRAIHLSERIADHVHRLVGAYPKIDYALVTLSRALHLPSGAALGLFALGRTIGWIAHAIEQYEQGQLIRPRARYTGPPISSTDEPENRPIANPKAPFPHRHA